jgi:hypothetical protein
VDNGSDVMVWAFKESMNLAPAEQAAWLLDHVGPRIASAALGMSDARQLKRWRAGEVEPRAHDVALRLPLLFRIAWAVSSVFGDRTAALFLRSANPQLNDEAPLMVLRDNPPEEVQGQLLAATQAFLAP